MTEGCKIESCDLENELFMNEDMKLKEEIRRKNRI